MMKRLSFFFLFLMCGLCSRAQHPILDAKEKPPKRKTHQYLKNFTYGFPILNVDICYPFGDKKLSTLPYGLGSYFNNTQPSVGLFVPSNDGSFRILSLYYKEQWGIELYYASYGVMVSTAKYAAYLAQSFPGYYTGAPTNSLSSWFSYFQGFMYGVTYKIQKQKYVIEPKFLFSLFNIGNDVTDNYQFKEKGSNSFLYYNVEKNIPGSVNPGFRWQLNFARKINCQGPHLKAEIGVKAEYMYMPYREQITLSQQPYGGLQSVQRADYKGTYQMASIGVYYALYFGKKHPVTKPRPFHF